jgi:hypothetical protein
MPHGIYPSEIPGETPDVYVPLKLRRQPNACPHPFDIMHTRCQDSPFPVDSRNILPVTIIRKFNRLRKKSKVSIDDNVVVEVNSRPRQSTHACGAG